MTHTWKVTRKLCDYCTSPHPRLETEEGLVFCDETCHHYWTVAHDG